MMHVLSRILFQGHATRRVVLLAISNRLSAMTIRRTKFARECAYSLRSNSKKPANRLPPRPNRLRKPNPTRLLSRHSTRLVLLHRKGDLELARERYLKGGLEPRQRDRNQRATSIWG